MAQGDVLKRYLDMGVALGHLTRARAEEIVRDLVKAGEVQREQTAQFVEELLDRSRRNAEMLAEVVRGEVRRQLAALNRGGGAGKRAPAKKAAAEKSPAKKAAAKAPAAKTAAEPKKAAAKKAAPKKAAPKKAAPKKAAAAKAAPAKAVVQPAPPPAASDGSSPGEHGAPHPPAGEAPA